MELKNKVINFLGDSITFGSGASAPEKCFVSRIAAKTGAVCNNYGIGGTRIAKQHTPSSVTQYDGYYNSRVAEMDKNADLVVVFGGTNDYGHGDAALGDMSSRDEGTFLGAMNVLCENLISTFPRARIVFITPLHRLDEHRCWNEYNVRNILSLPGYCEEIKKVCAVYSLPVIDAYADSGLNPAIPVIRETYMPDGLHPSDAGHDRFADFVIEQLKSL